MHFSDQFPILNNYTYLNTANSGILSQRTYAWRNAHDKDFLANGSVFRLQKDEFLQNGRNVVADFFNADANRTYLVPNFSYGFNILLEGLDSPKRFLLFSEDYPSINYPVESRGHECAYVKVDEHLEQSILETIERFKPEVMAFSLVQYANGIKTDLNFIKRLKADYPEILIVADGTQFCGTTIFDFKSSGIDALIASGYKWLLGGYGNGILMLSEDAAKQLYVNEKKIARPTEVFLKGRDTLLLYFEPGHLDTLNFGTLFNSITYLQEQGIDNVETRIKVLSSKARLAFTERNLLSPAIVNRKEHSNIFSLMLSDDKIKELQDSNILFTYRGAGVRVSFHFYNSEEDLERLLEVIDK